MEAAIAWGLTPFEYWDRPEMEQAIMLAHFRERRLRKAHAQHAESQVQEKKSSSSNSRPPPGMLSHEQFFGGV